MTFILNVLHKDMSILAADQKAVAEWPTPFGFPSRGKAVSCGNKKIFTNLTRQIAIGASGYSEHNSYIEKFKLSEANGKALSVIRDHMESFLLIDDIPSLINSASQFENECIATFYDRDTETFFTNEFKFNEFSNSTRLHRANDEVKIFCAGSGRYHFDINAAKVEVKSLLERNEDSNLVNAISSWVESAFKKVSELDDGCGAEPMLVISKRENHSFKIV